MRAWRGCLVKEKILEVVDLCKEYPVKRGALLPKEIGMVHAVNHVSFTLYQGETLGIIGESGCGKTTLIRMLMGLEEATGGYVQFGDKKIHRHMPPLVRKNMQMVFQDPYASLDPRMSIQRILEEPLRIHERMSAEEKKSRILPLLEQVGLSRSHISDRVLVMYLGQAVELAEKEDLFEHPLHPYTQALMQAVPIPDPREQDQCKVLEGEIPSPMDLPSGCPFCARCKKALAICKEIRPQMAETADGHQVACHLYTDGGKQ